MFSKSTQTTLLNEFRSITRATQADATRILKSSHWKIEEAVAAFYSDPIAMKNADANSSNLGSGGIAEIRQRLDTLFTFYADPTSRNSTNIDGTLNYCQDLQVDPEDPIMVAVSWLCKAPTMGEFSRAGFVDGWSSVRRDSIQSMRTYLDQLRGSQGFGNEEIFRKIYNYTFDWSKQPGQKSLQCDTAIAMWNILLPLSTAKTEFTPKHLQLWTEFLTGPYKSKAISKDSWTLFLEFWKSSTGDFSEHDLDAAWPSVIDDFVEWARPKLN